MTQTATRPLTIDIAKGRDGRWYVAADEGFGLMHDVFNSQAEAVAFATAFYGGTVEPVGKPAASKPACKAARTATPERIAFYGTTWSRCGCPDHQNRQGGSHYDEIARQRVCYHILTVRTQQRVACAQEIVSATKQTVAARHAYTDSFSGAVYSVPVDDFDCFELV